MWIFRSMQHIQSLSLDHMLTGRRHPICLHSCLYTGKKKGCKCKVSPWCFVVACSHRDSVVVCRVSTTHRAAVMRLLWAKPAHRSLLLFFSLHSWFFFSGLPSQSFWAPPAWVWNLPCPRLTAMSDEPGVPDFQIKSCPSPRLGWFMALSSALSSPTL